jgi:hypothetical protein
MAFILRNISKHVMHSWMGLKGILQMRRWRKHSGKLVLNDDGLTGPYDVLVFT